MISCIVSTYDKPESLLCCLASLACQSGDLEFIVTCNHREISMRESMLEVSQRFDAHVYYTVDAGAADAYYAAEMAVSKARGEWLCFPSEDSYYVPFFFHYVLEASQLNHWDFVYADMLHTSRWTEPPWTYSVMDVRPIRQHIDKTCFLLKRELFNGFPGKKNGAASEADGELAEELVSRGVSHGKASGGALVVHN